MTTAMLRAQAGALRSPDRRPAGSRAVPRRPAPVLLERDLALQTMVGAVQAAAAGSGSVVLVSGEAGIGKTSVVRAFVEQAAGLARVLVGACDDLMTPRPLGPLRDAAAGSGGRLEAALTRGGPDVVFDAVTEQLTGPVPTVLLIEDLQWVDEATLDVLVHLVRRLPELPGVVVLTCRDDALAASHPAQRLLGALVGCPVHRPALPPLSASAVGVLAAGAGRPAADLHELTGGNPFYVTEALRAPPDEVPVSVADAVLARVRRLPEPGRQAVEQLAVVPTFVEIGLAEALLGDRLAELAAAEAAGIIEMRTPSRLAFRHELARRAIEQSVPRLRRRGLHRAVVAALSAAPRPDVVRLVHHAVQAGDATATVRFAPRAGREAAAAGSHRQALEHFAAALRYPDRFDPAELARLVDDHAWELYNAHRYDEAMAAGGRAVDLYRALDDRVGLGEALVRLSRHRYMVGDTPGATDAATQAVAVLDTPGSGAGRSQAAVAHAATYHGAILALTDRPVAARPVLDRAEGLARRAGRPDLVALCLNYRSIAVPELTADERLALLRQSLTLALEHGAHEAAARAYTNLGELLHRFNRLDELGRCVADGLAFTAERGFPSHAYNLDVHRCLRALRLGDWAGAEAGLRALVEQDRDPGMLAVYSLPPRARLLARRGSSEALPLLEQTWARALRQRSLLGTAFTGAAMVEWAWLNDRPERAAAVVREWAPYASRPAAEPASAELLRYAMRAGLDVAAFPGCPEPWAAGLRGDWRSAAAGWAEIGDPYERALELACSGEVEPTVEALHDLEDLGADAAVRMVRRSLRASGVRRVPRRANAGTRANPAGVTHRQLDVLALLADGLTNAEIADRLVVSVRTVDSHVAAVLAKLGVRSRREAAAVVRSWDRTAS